MRNVRRVAIATAAPAIATALVRFAIRFARVEASNPRTCEASSDRKQPARIRSANIGPPNSAHARRR
ncbi:hypothetical protein WJ85_24845 [Burkholderia ubonensis]|nr:hypothetical protein WJ76_03040 [Burkholderia ubonensis]KVP32659.1 hypothetical protein WJ85_24845 [Burkholderia ubonensis]